ncbi:MAG TPA: 2-hydroxychromene-2-carboxylate isomerase [Candidatus Polarisedimenticolia bacterium]
MAAVQFWFEFASSYSYVAAQRIEDLARAQQVPIEWKPFLLGPLFRRQGWNDSPFNLYPARGRYMWRDIERQCRRQGIPFRKPSVFPRNSLLAARVACAADGERWMPEFARAAFRANFAEDREIADVAVIEGVLRDLGQDAEAVLALAQSPGNKERLRLQTEAAWSSGVFGAPSLLVDGELFWGNDRLEEAFLWYKDPGKRG